MFDYLKKHQKSVVVVIALLLAILLLVILFLRYYGIYNFGLPQSAGKEVQKSSIDRSSDVGFVESNTGAYKNSLLKNDTKPLNQMISNDMSSGVNDKFTKSNLYFFTHRYFDNGGNIYEIYDYVNKTPELSFMKEAEDINPMAFSFIKRRAVPNTFNGASTYAVLAYLEVLDKHGYADIASLATLANQYAKLAYFQKKNSEGFPDMYPPLVTKENGDKALVYLKKTNDEFLRLMKENNITNEELKNIDKFSKDHSKASLSITPHSLLVGINQYVASVRYLKAYGVDFKLDVDFGVLVSFNYAFAHEYVPELEKFTALLNASTLALDDKVISKDITFALKPITMAGVFNIKKLSSTDLIAKLLTSKDHKENIHDLDVYGYNNNNLLAKKSPEYKKWLISNGWKESDFK